MDFQALMKQAQLVQTRFTEAQAKMHAASATGEAGAGLVSVDMKGTHEITAVRIDESLMVEGESEVLSDLIKAALNDAHQKLSALNDQLIKDATGDLGPMGGLPKMPRFF
jgi:DNA-binding YbaB/EbfC family protein